MKAVTSILLSFFLLLPFNQALAGGISLPTGAIFQRAGIYCGLINGMWQPGVMLKSGNFLPHKAKLKELRKKAKKSEGAAKKKLSRQIRQLKTRLAAESPTCSLGPDGRNGNSDDGTHIHLVAYPDIQDFEMLSQRGINTVLVELDANGNNWRATFEAAIQHNLRLIPMIWDPDANQSVWQWDEVRNEWQLDRTLYPNSVGAIFLGFLKDHPAYLAQTFAIYSFHEPLWQPEKTGPQRLKTFYRQITENIFPDGSVRVYGEDITMGWPQSDECLTGVLDYENHLVYPFVSTHTGRYRPFDVINNYYGPPTNDQEATIGAEIACLDERLRRYASAPPAATGRRPQAVVLLQTFVDSEYNDLWNRMPEAEEMEAFASALLNQRKSQLKGLGWYSFRQAADNYLKWLHKDRFDEARIDRWEVLNKISQRFFTDF